MNPFDIRKHPNCYRGHQYAERVVAGEILACRYVIGACKRYLRDISAKDHPRWYFNADKAEKFLRLVQKFEHVIGEWETKNIVYEDWQCFAWMNVMGFINRETGKRRFRIAHLEVARGNAKALCLNTDVPTPDRGLIKFGDLKVGDSLYASDGTICRITGRNQIHYPKAYRVHFSDGTTIDCSDKHLWVTSTKEERIGGTSSVKETREIFKTLKVGKENNHSVQVCSPVVGSRDDAQLAYVLGYWLGDGCSTHGKFTAHEDQFEEISSRFKSAGLQVSVKERKGKAVTFLAHGLTFWLREMGLLRNKHIPEKYFMAKETVRRELLRGLMDSDGTISKEVGNFTFCNTNERLARQTRRLVASLGYKATLRKSRTTAQNGFVGSAYYVTFSTPTTRPSVFGILAKEDRRSNRPTRYSNKRYITNVEEIDPKPMFCIEVDSKDRTFLVTDQYIPTHNSAMASQATLYFGFLDNPQGNQVACAATKRDQARIVLDSARAMARKNKGFLKKTGVEVLAHTIRQDRTNSVVRALSSDHGGLDGLNDVLAVLDELHAMKRETFEVITSGMSKRNDSLVLCITTAGFDQDSVGFTQSEYAKRVCLGEWEDEQMFALVYTLDPGDDIFDEKNWQKANPNWGVSVDPTPFRAKAEKCKVTPSDIPGFKVKHLNLWESSAAPFFNLEKFDQCVDPDLTWERMEKKKCRASIDLASKRDLTSTYYIFYEEGTYYILGKNFLPEDRFKEWERGNDIFARAVSSGHLILTPGDTISNDRIREEVEAVSKHVRISECMYDPWNATEMAQKLSGKIEMVEFKMNVGNLSEPMKQLDVLIRQGKIRHNGDPILRWCLSNVVAKYDHNDNVFPRKNHERLKIDAAVATIMALAGWIQDTKKDSVYESRGIRTVG